MSAQELQRVVVRMLFDPALVDAVYADASTALSGEELTDEERSWLVRADRRAWRADPWRRARALTGLLAEFPASAALASAGLHDASGLDGFFSSATFHLTIQRRGSLSQAFADWLRERHGEVSSWLDHAVSIELALSACARAARTHGPVTPSDMQPLTIAGIEGGEFSLHPAVRVVQVAVGSLEHRTRVLAALEEHPGGSTSALIEGPIPEELTTLAAAMSAGHIAPESEVWIVSQQCAQISVEGGSEALAQLLRLAEPRALGSTLLSALLLEGLEPTEAAEVLSGLVSDGILRCE